VFPSSLSDCVPVQMSSFCYCLLLNVDVVDGVAVRNAYLATVLMGQRSLATVLEQKGSW
jgi:hypothetical protein